MEQRIQYATTADGVRIAYSTMGAGPPLVHMPGWPFTNIVEELRVPSFRTYYETLAEHVRLIRFDHRDSGHSQRDGVPPLSFDGLVADLEAVLDKLGIERVSLVGFGLGGHVAALCAKGHPGRVRRIVLWDVSMRSPDHYPPDTRRDAILNLGAADWELFTETVAGVMFGWGSGDEAREFAKYLRACVSQEGLLRGFSSLGSFDHSALCAELTIPTLILQHATSMLGPRDGMELAATIPDSSLALLDGVWITTDARGRRAAEVILDFVGRDQAEAHRTERSAFKAVMFTDLVEHTEMMQRLGDAKGREVLREHERVTREALLRHGGTEIKTDGDSFMVSFAALSPAVECAIDLQRALAAWNETEGARRTARLDVRIGINAGEPVEEEGDLFGASVILAARIGAQADAGEIFIPEPVRHLLAGKPFVFADRGEFVPKGFDDAVRLFEVRWRD
jgi:class 3 adenylate cyclase